MRRLLTVLVGMAAMLMLTTAATAKSTAAWSLGLHASSTNVQPGDTVTFSGVLRDNRGDRVGNQTVYFYVSTSGHCSYGGSSAGSDRTDWYGGNVGGYSWTHKFSEAGTYSVGASYRYDSHPDRYVQECVTVTVKAPDVWAITLEAGPVSDGTVDLTGVVTDNAVPAADESVMAYGYDGAGCTGEPWGSDETTTAEDGSYGFTASGLDPGTYSFQTESNAAVSGCVDVTVGAVAPVKSAPEASIFLCYSKWQEVPGVWPYGVAKNLVENEGYWLPYAVPGNVPFGTNIGGFHLACNVVTTQSVSDSRLGAGGETYAPGVHQNNLKNVFGAFYPVAGK